MGAITSIIVVAGVSLAGLLLAVEILARAYTYFIKPFPVPPFFTSLINTPLRRLVQSPAPLLETADIRAGMAVLEVGPGAGTFTVPAARAVGPAGRVVACDLQAGVITRLNKVLTRAGADNVEAVVASAYELAAPDSSQDRVFMVTVLGEIPDKGRALAEVARVLKAGGLFAVDELWVDPHYCRRRSIIRWCRAAGLEPIRVYDRFIRNITVFRKAGG